jgi:DNA-binding beta-propeller fold protein YncE
MRNAPRYLALTAILAAGCGSHTMAGHAPPSPTSRPPLPAGTLWLETGGGLTAVDGVTGAVARRLPAGPLAPGRRVLFTAAVAGDATTVEAVAPASGRRLASRRLAGSFALPRIGGQQAGLSRDGGTLVVEHPGERTSSFVVLDARTLAIRARLDLRGAFGFDALSADGKRMYLIERLGAAPASRYSVRSWIVGNAGLDPDVVVSKSGEDPVMGGYPIARAVDRAGTWVYTLYRQADGHVFVHALDTAEVYALCLDLPAGANSDAAGARAWGIGLSRGDATLWAANASLGLVARAQAPSAGAGVGPVELTRVGGGLGALGDGPHGPTLAIAPDGTVLYALGGRGLMMVPVGTLQGRSWLGGRRLVGLGLTAGGTHLLAATGTGVEVVDASTGRGLAALPVAGVTGVAG